ncbi:MAG: hypothetical protein DHS20C18_33760 [Saprospiraceae bacterium]|nr:MAG: hypothetical protein DHS20C18_33760 [Saprospiraceae bacterium]
MKNIVYTLLIFVLLIGCKKETLDIQVYFPGSMTYGKVTAMKGNKDWIASGLALRHGDRPDEYIGIYAGTFSEEGFRRERIYFNEVPIAEGEYIVKGLTQYDGFIGTSYSTLADDGDIVEDVYISDDTRSDNRLTITEIDTVINMVKGTFHVTFILPNPAEKINPQNPDRITFSNGEFEVQLID